MKNKKLWEQNGQEKVMKRTSTFSTHKRQTNLLTLLVIFSVRERVSESHLNGRRIHEFGSPWWKKRRCKWCRGSVENQQGKSETPPTNGGPSESTEQANTADAAGDGCPIRLGCHGNGQLRSALLILRGENICAASRNSRHACFLVNSGCCGLQSAIVCGIHQSSVGIRRKLVLSVHHLIKDRYVVQPTHCWSCAYRWTCYVWFTCVEESWSCTSSNSTSREWFDFPSSESW